MNNINKIGDHDKIMSDRKVFNETVYTPMSEALRLLEERRKDPILMAKVEKLLNGDIPEVFRNKKCGVLCRQVATPNHESRMFIDLAKENNLHPVFFEYLDDKFDPSNAFKHSLGKLNVPRKISKNGNHNIEKITIIDFNLHNGKKLREVKTLWGESLIDFQKKIFNTYGYNTENFDFPDVSFYFKGSGKKVTDYYINIFTLFTCFGILFENFLTSKNSEGEFTKNVVLPALEKVIKLTGVKPLIIPVGPLEIEDDDLWYYYSSEIKKHIPTELL